jgi:predicted Fe-Mo cluster-binding NifX family protein
MKTLISSTGNNTDSRFKVVEKAIDLGAGKVISGDFGPRARDLLERFHIQMVILPDDKQTIGQIIERLKQN